MYIYKKNKNYKALKLNHNPLKNYVELLKYLEMDEKISRINNVVFKENKNSIPNLQTNS